MQLLNSSLCEFSCGAGAKPPPLARPSGRAGWGSSRAKYYLDEAVRDYPIEYSYQRNV